jgi:hypothetical protein
MKAMPEAIENPDEPFDGAQDKPFEKAESKPFDGAQDRLAQEPSCRHHWLLGQPDAGQIKAVCKVCGSIRVYPAVLDDLDPGIEPDTKTPPESVATAAGGARPSAGALDAPSSGSGRSLIGDQET